VPYYDDAERLLGVLHLGNKKTGFDETDEAIVEVRDVCYLRISSSIHD